MSEKQRPLYSFKIGDFVKDAAGVKFEIVKFNSTEVTLLDSSGEYSYAHPLYSMEPWIAEKNNAPQT